MIAINDLDQSINEACKNFKSSITNFLQKNITKFNITNKSKKNKKKITHIAKCRIDKNGIRFKVLNKMKALYNGEQYNFENVKAAQKCNSSN